MDENIATSMGETNILQDAVQVNELGLGEDGKAGVFLPAAKTHEQERQETKAENEKIRQHLQNGIKLTDKKYLPRAGVKLSKVAPRVFAAIRANPPEWMDEFDQFISNTVGKCPSHTVRAQAANEWDAYVMGALLAFGYFDELMKEGLEEELNQEKTHEPTDSNGTDAPTDPVAAVDVVVAEPTGGDSACVGVSDDCGTSHPVDDVESLSPAKVEQPVPNMARERGVIVSPNTGAVGDTFAILGPDGEMLIEKRR